MFDARPASGGNLVKSAFATVQSLVTNSTALAPLTGGLGAGLSALDATRKGRKAVKAHLRNKRVHTVLNQWKGGPNGWALLGAGMVAGIGLGAFRLYRKYKKNKATWRGEYYGRLEVARKLCATIRNEDNSCTSEEIRFAEEMVKALVGTKDIEPIRNSMGGVDLITRKLESW